MQTTTVKSKTYNILEAEIVCLKALIAYDRMSRTLLPYNITQAVSKEIGESSSNFYIDDFLISDKGDYYVEATFINPFMSIRIKESKINSKIMQSRINYLQSKNSKNVGK